MGMAVRHWEAGVLGSSADWFKAGVAQHLVGPTSLEIAPRMCTILNKLLLLLLLLLLLPHLPHLLRNCVSRVYYFE